MSFALIDKVNQEQKKHAVVDVRSGDTVRVHQKIKEGNKSVFRCLREWLSALTTRTRTLRV